MKCVAKATNEQSKKPIESFPCFVFGRLNRCEMLSIQGNLIRFRDAAYWLGGAFQPITGSVGATLIASILNTDADLTPVTDAQEIPMTLDPSTTNDWSCTMPAIVTLKDRALYCVCVDVSVGGVTVPIRQRIPASYPTGSAPAT